jgi:ABC-2 type transport system permease protein
MLYIAIPVIAIIPFFYTDVWQNIHIYWDARIPLALLLTLLLFLSNWGNIRTYLLDSDLLFLIQKKSVIYQLKRDSFLISLLFLFLTEIVLTLAVLPVLIAIYHFSGIQIFSLFLTVSTFKLTVMTIKQLVDQVIIRWLLRLVSFGLTEMMLVTMPPVSWIVICGIVLFLMIFLNARQFSRTNRWAMDLEHEYDVHTRLIRLILRHFDEVPKPLMTNKRKPLFLFRRSGRIFKERSEENGLLEFLLKSVVRNRAHLSLYYKLIGITCLAVLLMPIWIKWTICVLFIWFMNKWLGTLFRDIVVNDWFILVPYQSLTAEQVFPRFQKYLALPSDILVVVIATLSTMILFVVR